MSAAHTLGRMPLVRSASVHQVAVIDCLEQARIEPRRHVAFWWLDMAATHRRHYVIARASIAEATGEAA